MNEKEELYYCAEDPHEWTNLALNPNDEKKLIAFREQLLAQIPQSTPREKPSAVAWKDDYFQKNPSADANQDGTLSWPELKTHQNMVKSGQARPASAPTKSASMPTNTAAVPEKQRLQTSGTFSKNAQGELTFTDKNGGQDYFVINPLAVKVTPHLDKEVKVVAIVKPGKTKWVKLMVHIVSIQ